MKYLFLFLSLSLLSCNQTSRNTQENQDHKTSRDSVGDNSLTEAEAFARVIEKAHNKEDWVKKEVISFDIRLLMGGEERLNARIQTRTNSSRIRLDKEDGSSLVFDGSGVYQSPASAAGNGARFDMFTWQYFFAFPFKLRDEGTNWDLPEKEMINGIPFERAKLSFDASTGDAPDDWYIVYREPKSGMLYAAAYIVTLNEKKEIAEEEPHAIVYHNYKLYNNIPLATRWTFHNWSSDRGIGDQIGEAEIDNIQFIPYKEERFKAPADSRKIELN